ncbi:hypothetical protein MIND_01309000 [Mycena indigotica]|uniref:Diacylglycerol O-acyltransferase n=1 Tax=Mycena indigotica TaxID=2126181 RepID=A0A8H6VQV3_9AGAR|nr:uncharacterized protein MIND_01309000 [Mycena indigotica]KAF7290687.1 hypothetical protein MIND_01309000 [Mycena indigotica]
MILVEPLTLTNIPPDSQIVTEAKELILDSHTWKQGRTFYDGLVQTAHKVFPDGGPWHSRVSRHSLPFDQFSAMLGDDWMLVKKAFNDAYIHEIDEISLVKKLSPTASIWKALYRFPSPIAPRVFTILQVTHLDAEARSGWVVHIPIDLDDSDLEKGVVKGRYSCVENITDLSDGQTEWRLVTCNTPGGWIPTRLAENSLPARMALDVVSFIDWYSIFYLKTRTLETMSTSRNRQRFMSASFAFLGVILSITSLTTSSRATTIAAVATWASVLYTTILSHDKVNDFLPAADRLLIGMRDPMIPSSIELEGRMSLPQLKKLIRLRLLAIPRMSHRLVTPILTPRTPYWEPCQHFDLDEHVHEHSLAPGAGYTELRGLLERNSSTVFNATRPPWEITLIQPPDRGSLLFTRVHHAITDGRGLTDILLACGNDPRSVIMPRRLPKSLASTSSLFSRLVDLRHLDSRPEPLSAIKCMKPLQSTSMAWLQSPWNLSELKTLTASLGGGTVNDVVLTVVAGVLRTHLRNADDSCDRPIQCKLPVDMFVPTSRTPDVVLGTHLGDLNVPIPTNIDDIAKRFVTVRQTMDEAKSGYRSWLASTFAGVVGALPTARRLSVIAADARNVSCYVSNMKGPMVPVHLGPMVPVHLEGTRVKNVRCHPLGLNTIGVAFAVYSYAENVNVAICTDRALIPDAEVLCGYLEEEMNLLKAAAAKELLTCGVEMLGKGPQFSSDYSVVLSHPLHDVGPVVLPENGPSIKRFVEGTRAHDASGTMNFIHHHTDFVYLDLENVLAADNLPLFRTLRGLPDRNDFPVNDNILQRDYFTVVERVPVLFGFFSHTVTVKSWGIVDPVHHIAAYETEVEGTGVRVWKMRRLKSVGERCTNVVEQLRGICPKMLRPLVAKQSAQTHRATMDAYARLLECL